MKGRITASMALALLALLALQACTTGSTSGVYTLNDGSTVETTDETYASTTSDESAVYVTDGTLTLNNPTITKSGDVSSTESCKKGLNAAVLASSSSATITINDGSITSSAVGGNAAFAYDGATVNLDGVAITCTGTGECRALYATYGGIITATDVTASTTGSNSSCVATDIEGGTITLTGGTFSASGKDSAGIYSTGTITGSGVTAGSSAGEACVIEGSNSITLTGSSVLTTGATNRGILILNSGSGDASGYDAVFTMTDGSITATGTDGSSSEDTYQAVPLFEVTTNTKGTITLTDVALTIASGTLMEVDYNTRWSVTGATGVMVLKSASGSYAVTGNILADSYSTATMTVGSGVTWTGAFDAANAAKSGTVTIESGGTLVLTADSYVDAFTNGGTLTRNGHKLYKNGTEYTS